MVNSTTSEGNSPDGIKPEIKRWKENPAKTKIALILKEISRFSGNGIRETQTSNFKYINFHLKLITSPQQMGKLEMSKSP